MRGQAGAFTADNVRVMFFMMCALDSEFLAFSASQAPSRLFFSVFPDRPAADQMAQAARDLRRRFGLRGRPLVTSRFHSSLYCFEDCSEASPNVVAKAGEAAEIVRATPFLVSFNCAKSFSGREGNHPLVLAGEDGVVGLTMLYSSLCVAMRRVGFRPTRYSSFTPHVTLLYDRCCIDEQPIEPICWTVAEIVLVLSLIGKTKHVPVGRWHLRG
jgi:2'-5' RNA ligase